MKKLTAAIMSAFLMFTLMSTPLKATTRDNTTPVSTPTTLSAAETNTLTVRLQEIKGMDRSNMSSSEKRTLRKETRSIKRQLSGGVYVSAGAIIIIALLLILLL